MPRVIGFMRSVAITFAAILGLIVVGLFGAWLILGEDFFAVREVESEALFVLLASEEREEAGRKLSAAVIEPAAPVPAQLRAVHESLARTAAKRLLPEDGDAIAIRIVVHRDYPREGEVLTLRYSPRGDGWRGDGDWVYQVSRPEPPLPKAFLDILRLKRSYREETPAEAQNEGGMRQFIAARSDATPAEIEAALDPTFVTIRKDKDAKLLD